MATTLDQNTILQALDWAYDAAVNGVPGLATAQELAAEYLASEGTLREQVDRLIGWQNTVSATSGFLTGIGGIFTLPVTLPVNISLVLYLQIRLIAAIAYMGGHDLHSARVRTLVFFCLTGSAAKDVLKDIGITIGRKLTERALQQLSDEALVRINQQIGFRLLATFSEKGVIELGKAVPLVGGLIGATLDAVSTNVIGAVARDTFIDEAGSPRKPRRRRATPQK